MSRMRSPGNSDAPLPVLRRRDLIAVETRHANESAFVIKDPIALRYHRMRPDEYFVLQQLDGTHSLDELRKRYEAEFAPRKVTAPQLNQLLFRFHQLGLTISDATLQGDRLRDRHRKERRERWLQHLSGVLFIRFPGVDPEPLLRRCLPLIRLVLSPLGVGAALTIALIALFVAVTQWHRFVAEFPQMHQWLRFDSLIILAASIGLTKVLHEIGHAAACKRFGGECHQIGPMLLVFTPALYCDTSDSWMLPNRFQRAAVGVAGIVTEVFLAALATLVWASTGAGLVHYVAMNVMLVCSVSTLVFNANPLLRYDGYYVLADLCDVPNLAERARQELSGLSSRWLLGVDEPHERSLTSWGRFWLLAYGLAAALYRWMLTLVILWLVSLMLRPYGLESVGRLLCLFAVGGLLFALLRRPLEFLRNPARRRLIKMKRTSLAGGGLLLLVLLACIPLPSSVIANARITPRTEVPIYVVTSGQVESVSARAGQRVSAGDEIVRLANPDVEVQLLVAEGRLETQQRVVETLRQSQVDAPQAAAELLPAAALLEDLRQQVGRHQSRRAGLVLRAPRQGRLIAAAKRPDRHLDPRSEVTLASWSGYPDDAENKHCLVETGMEFMTLVPDDQWDAELVLPQEEVRRFGAGARVNVIPLSAPSLVLRGTVVDVARAAWTEERDAQRRDDPSGRHGQSAVTTSYAVRVQLESSDEDPALVAGATARARIVAEPISVVGRITRFLNRLLRFR